MKKIILFLGVLAIMALGVHAQGSGSSACEVDIPLNAQAFLADLNAVDSELSNCPIVLPQAAATIFGDGVVQITITMNDGTTSGFSLTLMNGQLVGAGSSVTSYAYEVSTDEGTIDSLVASQFGNFLTHYDNGDIIVSGGTFFNSIRIFFVNLFAGFFIGNGDDAPAGNGQPANCHGTHLPGWTEYSNPNTQQQWDQYTAETDGVCQFDVGTAGPQGGDCVYTFQKVQGGATSWLCWYNN